MTQYQRKQGNRIVKYALLTLITDIMTQTKTQFVWLDEGYENDNQRIHFSSGGHKCMLEGVGRPNPELGVIDLTVRTDFEGEKDQRVDVPLFLSDIHINTVEKIACEVYNAIWNPEKDDDYDIVRDEYVSGFLDTYLR